MSERQYRITRAWAKKFEQAIADLSANPAPNIHLVLRKAELRGLESRLDDLKSKLREYETLRSEKPVPQSF